MNILVLTRYGTIGATSRLRFYQYFTCIESHGIKCTVEPLFSDDYVNSLYIKPTPIISVLKSYCNRLSVLLKKKKYDLIWVEKEILPWLPSWFELALLPRNIPLVVDYDDATFHRYDQFPVYVVRALLGKKIDHIMKRADVVIAGNDYLGSRAIKAGSKHIEIIPTVVDAKLYASKYGSSENNIVIGWIGSPSTAKYLHLIEPVIKKIALSDNVKFVGIGAHEHQLKGLPIQTRVWAEETEISQVQEFDIGIMPLPDEPFERGKCGYKLIQYMACGKPVVASPVGVNKVIVKDGENGYLASSTDDWYDKLRTLIDNRALRQKMGENGRQLVEEKYSLQVTAPKLVEIFRALADSKTTSY
jgi:glycosyltransferase involved in cell wall biosynthesis